MTRPSMIIPLKIHEKIKKRILSKIILIPNTNCWEWNGARSNNYNHGRVSVCGINFLAHRASLLVFTGIEHSDLFACHKCNNPPCVNPDHLYWRTPKDNTRDSIEAGTKVYIKGVKGETNGSSKLSFKDVEAIKSLLKEENLTQKEIGKKFGVAQTTISAINTKQNWGHLA